MPVAPTLRSPLVTVEMVRLLVEAVAEYAMPLVVMLVVEALVAVIDGVVMTPALSIVVVAVAPKRDDAAERLIAYKLVPVALVKVSPPLKLSRVVVALLGNKYPKVA